jgi:flagellin
MEMRINNNIMAFNASRNLSVTNIILSKNLEKLSSGLRINRAADDAAGLVISENLRSQLGGMQVATRNAQDGISVVQTAEGSLNEVQTILQRMRDLAVQSANTGSNDATARNAAQAEITQLAQEIDRIGSSSRFASNQLFTTAAFTFQIGARSTDTVNVTVGAMTTASLTITTVSVTTGAAASASITTIDNALAAVSTLRGNLGAVQNRFESTVRNLGVAIENTQAAESRIRDTDMAFEMVNYSKNSILQQAGTAMLSQANSAPRGILGLLQG